MARQIAYDPQALRQSLVQVFWERGYAETSLPDLEAASGLNRRQLYNGIGDKRAMFLGALDDFSEDAGRRFLAPLERADAGVAEIETLLETFLQLAEAAQGPGGCLVCSTSQDEIAADPDVARRVDAYLSRIRAAYHNALSHAAARGEIEDSAAVLSDRADALFGLHVALCILARAGRPVTELRGMVRHALADLR